MFSGWCSAVKDVNEKLTVRRLSSGIRGIEADVLYFLFPHHTTLIRKSPVNLLPTCIFRYVTVACNIFLGGVGGFFLP